MSRFFLFPANNSLSVSADSLPSGSNRLRMFPRVHSLPGQAASKQSTIDVKSP